MESFNKNKFLILKKIFIVIQLQLYAFSPHPSTPPQEIFNFNGMKFINIFFLDLCFL